MKTISYALVLVCLLLAAPAHAKDGLVFAEKFSSGKGELAVAHFTQGKNRVGLIGVSDAKRNSFSFTLEEWGKLIDIWKKAVAAQSPSWKVVGEMSETDTKDQSHLVISAGPGVTFFLESPGVGPITYVLSSAEMARFEKGLNTVRAYLSE